MLQLTTIIFVICFSMLALLHIVALQLSLYWYFPWLDLVMHAFGGSIITLGFFTLRDLKIYPNNLLTIKPILFFLLCIAILWELFELWAGVPIQGDFILDTSLDLMCGLLGGYVGYIVGTSLRSLR